MLKKHIKSFLFSIIIAQIISTLQVYLSNILLYKKLTILKNTGYLIVPNHLIYSKLLDFSTSFWSGLFFTLSIGIALYFVSFVLISILYRNKYFLFIINLIWILTIFSLNYKGFCFISTAYFVIIPVIVFWTSKDIKPINHCFILLPIVIIFLIFFQTQQNLFINFRDYVLLSNPIGTKINDFYYKYTLYPAEVFKTLSQKQIKTCSILNIKAKYLENILLNYDFLCVENNNAVDLKITFKNNNLILQNAIGISIEKPLKIFLANPEEILKEFSKKEDRYPFFRMFTLISILISLFALFYLITNSMLFFVNEKIRFIFAYILLILFILVINTLKPYENKETASLNSIHPNTICMALSNLGKIGDKKAIPIILDKINNSDHWYVQLYAYNALRTLGWKQTKSY
ncbi:MAG: hypothetical protein HQK79_17235 [Desulfobacterales bacterium]|nr:hypothetical protein [Desulfobacterales bacterium]